jgi:hypothetical protein
MLKLEIDTSDLERALRQTFDEEVTKIKTQKNAEWRAAAERIECPDHLKHATVKIDGNSFTFGDVCCDKLRDLLSAETGLNFSA